MEVQEVLGSLRDSLLGELQKMRDQVHAMEEKVDYLVLERLEDAAVGKV